MPSVLRHLLRENGADILSAVKMEKDRTLILSPSISAIVLEIFISMAMKCKPTNNQCPPRNS